MSYAKFKSRNTSIVKALSSEGGINLDEFWEDCQSHRRRKMINSFLFQHETFNSKSQKKKRLEYSNQLYQRALLQNEIKKERCHNHIEQKNRKELDQCTWKPRLNKLTLQQKLKLERKGGDIYEREVNKQKAKWKLRQKAASQEGKCRSVYLIDYAAQKKIDNGVSNKNIRK